MKIPNRVFRFVTTSVPVLMILCAVLASVHAQPPAQAETHGISLANIDRSVRPGDDFYLYANGDWLKNQAQQGLARALQGATRQ